MREMSLFDAKTHLSQLIDDVYRFHEPVIITRRGQAVVKVVPIALNEGQDVRETLHAFQSLRKKIRTKCGSAKISELQQWKKEGRK